MEFEQARHRLGLIVDDKLLLTLGEPLGDGLGSITQSRVTSDHYQGGSAKVSHVGELTISEIYDKFLADPKHLWSKRTIIAHKTTRKWVLEVFGASTPITAITRDGCREFVNLLRRMPPHADKRYPDLPVRAVVGTPHMRRARAAASAQPTSMHTSTGSARC